nr:lef4 [Calliteara abietis nucleopolyhedrovirus]
MSSFIEKEISYTINLSQDLLYIILSSYISKKYTLTQEYVDCVDENGVRSRLCRNRYESTIKSVQSSHKTVHVHGNRLVPVVQRTSIEQGVNCSQASPILDRILTCRVFRSAARPEIEIKFEQIYFERNAGDKFDSLMASKQIALINILQQSKRERISKNSHLGSDEIFAHLRLEYEYVGDAPNKIVMDQLAVIVDEIDRIGHYQNIGPLLPYTTLKNNIIYRKFYDELLLDNNSVILNNNNGDESGAVFDTHETEIMKWALKLDGVRGKGLFTRTHVVVFVDDMRMFAGPLPHLFSINNVVAFQCELINDTVLYITDLLHVFKYTYNNKTQYECSLDGHDVNAADAIDCLNHLHDTCESVEFCDEYSKIVLQIKFQTFSSAPILAQQGYSTVPTDGFVVLDTNSRYIKYKYRKTIELEYKESERKFCSLDGELDCGYRIVNCGNVELRDGHIYETVVDAKNKIVDVIKRRPDRLVPQQNAHVVAH